MDSLNFTAELNGIYRTDLNIGGVAHVLRISMPAILKINEETGSDLKSVFTDRAVQNMLLHFKKRSSTENIEYIWVCEAEVAPIVAVYKTVLRLA